MAHCLCCYGNSFLNFIYLKRFSVVVGDVGVGVGGVCVCVCERDVCVCSYRGQNRTSNLLKLELHMWVPRTKIEVLRKSSKHL